MVSGLFCAFTKETTIYFYVERIAIGEFTHGNAFNNSDWCKKKSFVSHIINPSLT